MHKVKITKLFGRIFQQIAYLTLIINKKFE